MESQLWHKKQMVEFQEARLRKLINHNVNAVPYYHGLFKNLGIVIEDIHTIDDLKKLPIVTKETIKKRISNYKRFIFADAYGNKDNDEKFDEQSITPVQRATGGIEPGGVEIEISQISGDKYLVSCPKQTVESDFVRK